MSQPDNFVGIFGHVNLDYIMEVEKLPQPNTSCQVENVKRFFGGTGANVALMSASMGVKAALASFVGPDFPEDFKQLLVETGVDICDLAPMTGYMTPTCRIMTDPQNNQIGIMDQGPMGHMDDFPLAEHSIIHSQIVHIGTGRPSYYRRIMEFAVEKDKPIYFDPAQEIHYLYNPESFRELLDMSHAFFCNESELATAMKYMGYEDRKQLLEHVELLIITLGKDGSQILTVNNEINIPAVPPEQV
ncbi:MAG: hypothetical protein DRI61_17490, partial [Chloroflexi bacterium]